MHSVSIYYSLDILMTQNDYIYWHIRNFTPNIRLQLKIETEISFTLMSHIKNMCLSGKLLKMKNYCKERRNKTFRHTSGCHGILTQKATQDYFNKTDTKQIPQ